MEWWDIIQGPIVGLLLNMGLVHKPTIESYFCEKYFSQHTPGFKIISLDRFKLLLHFFHVSDFDKEAPRTSSSYDPLYKFRDVLTIVNENFQKSYRLDQDISIDDSIIGFKGRHVSIQYIKIKKHHQWGPKMYVLAEAKTGYSYRLMFHCKQSTKTTKVQPHDVCMQLLKAENRSKNHHLGVDNYYTSVALCEDLYQQGVYVTGTVRQNRVGLPVDIKQKIKQKGHFVCWRKGPLLAVNFHDRNCVRLLSTFCTAKTNSKGDGDRARCVPSVVSHYNSVTGGVDTAHQLVQEYAAEVRTRKCWKKVVFHLLDRMVVNAYLLYKHNPSVPAAGKLSHHKFTVLTVEHLIGSYNSCQRPGRRSTCPVEARLDQKHFIEYIPDGKRKKCVVCGDRPQTFSGTRVRTYCPDCNVGLCIGECFRRYHTLNNYKM